MRGCLAGFVVAAAFAAACGGNGQQPSPTLPASGTGPPTATPAVSASPTAAPRLPDGAELAAVGFGPGIDLPKDVALIIETGCWQCDGPTTSLTRVYWQSATGRYVFENLVTPEKLGIGTRIVQTEKGPQEVSPEIAGFVAAPDASDIVVDICTGSCGMGGPGPDARTSLFRSRDGGITWQGYGKLGPGEFMTGEMKDGNVVVARYPDDTPATVPPGGTPPPPAPPAYHFYPSGEAISTPAGADGYWQPVILPGGDVAWLTHDGRLVDVGGGQIAATGGSFGYLPRVYTAPGGIALEWGYEEVERNYFAVFDAGGRTRLVYRFPEFLLPGPWIGDLRLFGNTGLDGSQLSAPPPFLNYLPALVDLSERLVHPIVRPFLDPGAPRGRNHVVAIQRGKLLRVVNTGSCLNVRAGPDRTAAVLDCAADGVLLRQGAGIAQYPGGVGDDGGWYSVITPAGGEGFASGEYLER